jgi:hypothetical protein
MQDSALKRRLTPFVPLTLDVENGDGTSFNVDLKLAFNMNVLASVREKCGQNLLSDVFSWIDDPKAVITVLWGATLPYQPEYNSPDGLEAIGEYMSLDNRVATIEALLQAYAYFVRKDKREAFVDSAKQIVEILRTGKLPDARPQTESETTQSAAIPSISMTSQTSPNTTSDLPSNSSENSQPIASLAS